MQRNLDVRQQADRSAVLLWQIAEGLGITDATFSRWLRKELPPERKREIFDIINQIAEARKEETDCS